ncbi:MAG TPA: TolC family protein [Thermoanaerobaculia bacterium]|nr:TolC family protein [Thermoanaerobaculia bacterium]
MKPGSKKLTAVGVLLIACSVPPAVGQEVRATLPDPELEALVREAIAKSPEVAGAAAAAAAARQRIVPAKTLPDPSVSLQYQNDGTSLTLGERDMTFLGAMYSQPIPWPGKLKLAAEEAEKRAERVEGEDVARARLAVEARARQTYWDLLLARSMLDLVEERRSAWRQIEAVARERYAAGLSIQQDVLRAQVELLRLDEARAEARATAISRLAELNRLLRRPPETPIEIARPLELQDDLPQLGDLLAAARRKSPELAGAGRAIEVASRRVDLAKKDFYPDFTVSAGPMYRGGLDPMWQAGVGVTLPIFARSRQGPRFAAATDERRSEEARAASVALDLDLRTRERFERLKAALEVARLYRDGVLAMDRLSLEAALASYRTGKAPFITVLEALNALYADRETYLGRVAEAERWRVAIDEAEPGASSMANSTVAKPAAAAGSPAGPPMGMR